MSRKEEEKKRLNKWSLRQSLSDADVNDDGDNKTLDW